MKRLSIIIVTYKSEKDIYDCLASIWNFCDIPKEELEIIVVDNSTESEEMFSKLKELYANDIVLIHNTHNGGYGQGNNVGIRQATAPVILIMNPDVRLYEPIFKTAIEAFETDDKLGIYGMKQMYSPTQPTNNSFSCTYMMNGYLFTFLTAIGTRFDYYLPQYMQFSGSCFFIRKAMFETVGLFDESVFMYGEEDDISYRMRKRFGLCLRYNPRLHYIHLAMGRKPSLDYEKKLLDVAIDQNRRKGYPRQKTIKNRLRNANLQYWREWLRLKMGKGNPALFEVMSAYRMHLKQLLHNEC